MNWEANGLDEDRTARLYGRADGGGPLMIEGVPMHAEAIAVHNTEPSGIQEADDDTWANDLDGLAQASSPDGSWETATIDTDTVAEPMPPEEVQAQPRGEREYVIFVSPHC